MAYCQKISVTKGVTASVGKFESVRIDASIEFQLGQNEDPDEVYERAWEKADEQINVQLAQIQDVIADTSTFKMDAPKPKSSGRRRK